MLTEEQKRRIESLYNEYYELAFDPEIKEDMKSFYMGKYMAIDDELMILGCSLKKAFKIEQEEE